MNYWKLVGTKLGLNKARLDSIEEERRNNGKCCHEMLAYWLQFDVNASWEKIQKIVQSLSNIEPMVPSSDLIINFKKYLQQRYSDIRVRNVVNVAFICHDHQCNMATKKSVTAVAKAMYYGNIVIDNYQSSDQNLSSEENTDYYAKCMKSIDILKLLKDLDSNPDREDPFLLLVEGAQGMGKTTICKEIAFQWAKHRGLYGQFTFLICLHEINLEHINSLEAFLEYICPEKQPATYQTVSNNLHSNEGKKVMFIIDGYERCSNQQKYSVDSFVQKIIDRKLLQKCDLVISSCDTASVNLYQCFSCRIEILGFTENLKQQYINKALDQNQKNIGELMAYLKEHSFLNSLCYNPLCLSSLVCLFQQSRQFLDIKLPTNQTEIINKITNRIVLSLSGSKEMHFLPLTTAVGSMPKEYQSILNTISKIAFYSLRTKNIVFKLSDIKSDINSADAKNICLNCLGFLKVINSFANTDINQMLFTFLHISLQEFLAAFYVSTLSRSKCAQIWKQTFQKSEFLNVWAYYCGITRDKNMLLGNLSSWFGIQTLPDDKIKCLYLVHCLMELPDDEIYQKVKPRVIANAASLNLSSCIFTQKDFQILLIFLLRCKVKQWSCLDLSYCHIDHDKLAHFFQQLQSFVTSIPTIKFLNLSNNRLSKISLYYVFQLAAIFNTVQIKLSCNEIEDEEFCESVISLTQKSVDASRVNGESLGDTSENSIDIDDSRILLELTEHLFTCQGEFSFLSVTCDKDNITICHKLDQISLAATFIEPHNFTQLLLVNCSVNGTFMINSLQNCDTLKFLHLQSINWNGEFLNCLDILKRHQFTLSIYESELSDPIVENIMSFVDFNSNVSVILSTDSIFLAHNCNYKKWKCHLAHNMSSMSLRLFYVSKCSLKGNVSENYLVENYLNSKKCITEIILCKNSLENKQLIKIIDVIKQQYTTKVFISEDYLNCNDAVNKLSCSSLMLVGSKIVIGEGATDKQVARAASLISPSTLVVRMIKCNFTCKGFELLVNSLMVCDKIQEFTFCRSNFNNTWGYKILTALQNTVTIRRLHLTSSDVTARDVDFLATALAAVISNNNKLERLSIAFNMLPPTASSKILKGLSEITSLKQLVYYNSENCSSELVSTITSNSGLEELRLNNYKSLQTDEIIEILIVLNRLSKLKVLSLSNNGISKTSAIDLAVAINDKHLHTLHLGSNNLQSKGTIAMAEMVKDISTLKNLVLNDNGINEEASYSLASLINANKNLEKLYLDNNLLKTAGMNKLTAILKLLTTLKVLNLKCNKLDSEAADGIAAAVTSNQSLEVINLSDNNLQTAGVIKVALALKSIHCLKCLDLSKNQITEEAADNISTAINCNTGLEKLLLHDNILKSNGIAIICAGIVKYINNLRVLRINSNYIKTKAADDIAEVITHNPLLEVIDVGNNRLFSEGVIKITRALEKLYHMKELWLNANHITEVAAYSIAAVINRNMDLQQFTLDSNHLNSIGTSEICRILKQVSTLRVFLVGNNRIDKHAADGIAEVITNNPLLVNVGLGNNQLQTEGVIIIANALKQIHNLTVLSLDNNQVTEEAANDIALAISSNTGLEKLWLNNNFLGTNGIQIICRSLKQINTLKLLQLENNRITKEATKDIADVIINNPSLETMYIGTNNIQTVGMNNITCALSRIKQLKAMSLKDSRITDKAANKITEAITSNSTLERLKLQYNSFEEKGVRMILCGLKQLTTLRVLSFSDVAITERAANDIAEVITNNPSLENFYLFNSKLPAQRIMKVCHSLSKIHRLKELDLNNNHLGAEAANEISEVILSNRNLEKLNLLNNNLKDLGTTKISLAMKNINALKIFNLSGNGITEKAADDIATVITNNPLLQNIHLGNNNLHTTGVIKVANALKVLCHLEELALNANQITEAAAEDIALAIDNNTQLETLLLNDNFFKANGIKIICKSLIKLTILKLLDLDNNLISEEAADDIVKVITNNPLLECIRLGNNNLQTTGILKVADALKDLHRLEELVLHANQVTETAANGIAQVISSNTQMKIVLLNDNFLKTNGTKTICNSLKKLTTLRILHLHNNLITEEAADDIAKVITNNPLLEFIDLGHSSLHTSGMIKVVDALKLLQYLKALALNANQITETVASDIAQVISRNVQLEIILLSDNVLKANGTKVLCKSLRKCTALKLLDLKNNSITEEAADDIAAVITNNQSLKFVNIGMNKLKSAGIIKIARALKDLSHLNILNVISNEITDYAADDIAKVIACNSELEGLRINNNHFSTVGIHKICTTLKNKTTLKLLDLENNKTTKETADDIAAVITNNTLLKHFNVNNCSLETKGIKKVVCALMKLHSLETLCLESNEITQEGANGIATVIKNNLSLQSVFLGNNKLQTAGVIKIANALKGIFQLKELDLRSNCITDEAGAYIAEIITSNTSLEVLFLDNNCLKATGIKTLCESLMKIATLKVLNLNNNEITVEVVESIVAVIIANPLLHSLGIDIGKLQAFHVIKITHALKSLHKMKLLQCSGSQITEEAAANIVEVISNSNQFIQLQLNSSLNTSTALKIINSCKDTSSLTVLDISNNNIEDEIAGDLKKLLLNNNCLQRLILHNNSFTPVGGKLLATAIQCLKHLKTLSIDKGILSADVASQLVSSSFTTKSTTFTIYNDNVVEESINFYYCLDEINSLLFCKTDFNFHMESIFVYVLDNGEALLQWTKDDAFSSSGILQIIKALRNVSTIKIGDSHFTEQEIDNMATILSHNVKLVNVWLGKKCIPQINMQMTNNYAFSLTSENTIEDKHISTMLPKLLNTIKSRNLLTLDLSGNIITEELLLEVQGILAKSTQLEVLLLRNCSLPEVGISPKLLNSIKSRNLKTLDLSNNYFTKEAKDQVAIILNKFDKLQTFQLQHYGSTTSTDNYISPQLLAIKSNNLRELDLSANYFTTEATQQLATVIGNCTALETLLLSNCIIQGIDKVINSLEKINTLNKLSLSWHTCITLKINANLSISLSGWNTQNQRGIIPKPNNVVKIIKNNKGLQELYLIGDFNAFNMEKLSAAIRNLSNLKTLYIDCKLISQNNKLVKPLIHNISLMSLCLINISLQNAHEARIHFNTSSRNMKSLKIARLSSNNFGTTSVIATVEENIVLVDCFQDNALASTGTLRIVEAITTGFTSLMLCSADFSVEDSNEIAGVIATFTELEELIVVTNSPQYLISINPIFASARNNLKVIRLPYYRVYKGENDHLTKLLQEKNQLQTLDLQFCMLNSFIVGKMLDTLKCYTTLKSLILSNNNITDKHKAANKIVQILLNNCFIKTFEMCNNRLKTEGIMIIMEGLKQLTTLKKLSIGSNNVSGDISDHVIDVINNNPRLKALRLDYTCTCTKGAFKVIRAMKSLPCLKLLDISGNNLSEEAADDIATVITNNPNLVKLIVTDNHLGVTGANKVAKALINPRGLKVLSLVNNNIAYEVAESIAEIITNNPSLESLLLGDCSKTKAQYILKKSDIPRGESTNTLFIKKQMQKMKMNTKFCEKQHYLAKTNLILPGSDQNLKSFVLNSLNCPVNIKCNKLESEGTKIISKALATIKSLQVLSIENNGIDDQATADIAAALVSNNGIRQLWIGQNHFTLSGVSTILQSLMKRTKLCFKLTYIEIMPAPSLEVLDLSHSNLSVGIANDISVVLSRNYSIQQLWLEGNNLSSQGITTIADALKKCTNICVLNLRDNNIREEIANVLTQAIANKVKLQQLYLGNNNLQDRGVIKITKALNTTEYLLTLDLMNNNISEAAADALASVITSCSQLEQLYLGDNKLQSTGTIKIARAIQQANCRSTLRVLDLSNNRIGSDEAVIDEISKAVVNTELLTVLILDDNAFSVEEVWKITRSLNQSEYMMIFSVMRNDVMISEETKDEMRAVMADQQPDCAMYL